MNAFHLLAIASTTALLLTTAPASARDVPGNALGHVGEDPTYPHQVIPDAAKALRARDAAVRVAQAGEDPGYPHLTGRSVVMLVGATFVGGVRAGVGEDPGYPRYEAETRLASGDVSPAERGAHGMDMARCDHDAAGRSAAMRRC